MRHDTWREIATVLDGIQGLLDAPRNKHIANSIDEVALAVPRTDNVAAQQLPGPGEQVPRVREPQVQSPQVATPLPAATVLAHNGRAQESGKICLFTWVHAETDKRLLLPVRPTPGRITTYLNANLNASLRVDLINDIIQTVKQTALAFRAIVLVVCCIHQVSQWHVVTTNDSFKLIPYNVARHVELALEGQLLKRAVEPVTLDCHRRGPMRRSRHTFRAARLLYDMTAAMDDSIGEDAGVDETMMETTVETFNTVDTLKAGTTKTAAHEDTDEDTDEDTPCTVSKVAITITLAVVALLGIAYMFTDSKPFMRDALWNRTGMIFLGTWAAAVAAGIAVWVLEDRGNGDACETAGPSFVITSHTLFGRILAACLLIPVVSAWINGGPLNALPQPILAGFGLLAGCILAVTAVALTRALGKAEDDDADDDTDASGGPPPKKEIDKGRLAIPVAIAAFTAVVVGSRVMLRRFAVPAPHAGFLIILLASPFIATGYFWGMFASWYARWIVTPLSSFLRGSHPVDEQLANAAIDKLAAAAQAIAEVTGDAEDRKGVRRSELRRELENHKRYAHLGGGEPWLHAALLALSDKELGALERHVLAHPPAQSGGGIFDTAKAVKACMHHTQRSEPTCRRRVETERMFADYIRVMFQVIYIVTPPGLAAALRCLVAHTQAAFLSSKVTPMLSRMAADTGIQERAEEQPRTQWVRTAIVSVLSLLSVIGVVLIGGVMSALVTALVAAVVLYAFGHNHSCWSGAKLVDAAQITAFRLLRVFDLRSYSGVGAAESIADTFGACVYRAWRAFRHADDLCLRIAKKSQAADKALAEWREDKNDKEHQRRYDSARSVVLKEAERLAAEAAASKLRALCTLEDDLDRILASVSLLEEQIVEERGYVTRDDTSLMRKCVDAARAAARGDRASDLPLAMRTFTTALLPPNLRLMQAHRLGYLIALTMISFFAAAGSAVGSARKVDNKAPQEEREARVRENVTETVTAALIVCFVLIMAVNGYIATM